jgi:hypothetical protein
MTGLLFVREWITFKLYNIPTFKQKLLLLFRLRSLCLLLLAHHFFHTCLET